MSERYGPAEPLDREAAFKLDANLPVAETWTGRPPRALRMPVRVRGRREAHRETREKAIERGVDI